MPRVAGMAIAAALATGAGAGAGAVAVATSGARETITVNVGDTIVPRFSIRTDTVLRVVGTTIVAAKCGESSIYLRTWKGSRQLSADTITAIVQGCVPLPPKVASVQLVNRVVIDDSGRVVGVWDSTMEVGASRCVFAIARGADSSIITGRRVTLSSDDTTIAKVTQDSMPDGSACPDTSVNPIHLVPAPTPARGVQPARAS